MRELGALHPVGSGETVSRASYRGGRLRQRPLNLGRVDAAIEHDDVESTVRGTERRALWWRPSASTTRETHPPHGAWRRGQYVVAAHLLPPQRRRTTPLPVGITMAVLHIGPRTAQTSGAWSEFRMA